MHAYRFSATRQLGASFVLLVGDKAMQIACFAEMFDRFFDCLNSSSLSAGKRSRNPFRSPYRSGNDWKLYGKLYGIPLHRSSFICTPSS